MTEPTHFTDCSTQLERLAWYRAIARRYVAAVNSCDLEGVLACFAEDAEVFDPMFHCGFFGQRALRMFYEPLVKHTKLEINGPISGTYANVIAASVTARLPGIEVNVISLTRFNDEGLISKYELYFGPDDVREVAA